MYSLRYGAVPVVRKTGGLADTVTDDDASPGEGVGFSFEPYTPAALVDAMKRAVRAFQDKARWLRIVRSACPGTIRGTPRAAGTWSFTGPP